MTNEFMQKAISGLKYIIEGEEFEGKKEIMTIVLTHIEGHIYPKEKVLGFLKESITESGKTKPCPIP
ncbi:hypothetical protein LS72_010430 [Helicobacter apodemus]|uniref:Uncharacterized protein n=1 Tax=Helicobacter apodemus TaxID=135569 RepID=A0A4U8UC67_9HELI|nr:hypothetical protein [Helicobacter apodemus]TLE12779.1 hypothetical protein LS72_010430 [Helicobacter apodemus]